MALKPQLLAATVTIGVAMTPSIAAACSCMRQSVEDQARMSTAIFVGVPTRTKSLGGFERVTTFRVIEALKGGGKTIQVFHRKNDGGNCGIDFQTGRQLLVTASSIEGKLRTNSCSMPRGSKTEFEAALAGKRTGPKRKP